MPNNPGMGAAPHQPMTDEEIKIRFALLREQIEEMEGRHFKKPELNFIGDLMAECKHRQRLLSESVRLKFWARPDPLDESNGRCEGRNDFIQTIVESNEQRIEMLEKTCAELEAHIGDPPSDIATLEGLLDHHEKRLNVQYADMKELVELHIDKRLQELESKAKRWDRSADVSMPINVVETPVDRARMENATEALETATKQLLDRVDYIAKAAADKAHERARDELWDRATMIAKEAAVHAVANEAARSVHDQSAKVVAENEALRCQNQDLEIRLNKATYNALRVRKSIALAECNANLLKEVERLQAQVVGTAGLKQAIFEVMGELNRYRNGWFSAETVVGSIAERLTPWKAEHAQYLRDEDTRRRSGLKEARVIAKEAAVHAVANEATHNVHAQYAETCAQLSEAQREIDRLQERAGAAESKVAKLETQKTALCFTQIELKQAVFEITSHLNRRSNGLISEAQLVNAIQGRVAPWHKEWVTWLHSKEMKPSNEKYPQIGVEESDGRS